LPCSTLAPAVAEDGFALFIQALMAWVFTLDASAARGKGSDSSSSSSARQLLLSIRLTASGDTLNRSASVSDVHSVADIALSLRIICISFLSSFFGGFHPSGKSAFMASLCACHAGLGRSGSRVGGESWRALRRTLRSSASSAEATRSSRVSLRWLLGATVLAMPRLDVGLLISTVGRDAAVKAALAHR